MAVEHLNANGARDIEPIVSVERHAVSEAVFPRRDVAQSGKRPFAFDRAIALDIERVDRVANVV